MRPSPILLAVLAGLALLAGSFTAAECQQPPPRIPDWTSDGETSWIKTSAGQVKTRAYRSPQMGAHPVLVLYVHGDIAGPRTDQYFIAQLIAHGSQNVVAAGLLRPGYRDPTGDTSSGKLGYTIGDNYTAEVVDAVDAAIAELRSRFKAKAVVLVGHSGGAAIVADLMGRHPKHADAALLLACGCDPKEFMARWTAEHPETPKGLPNPSLLPLDLAATVSRRAKVRLVIGSLDDVVRAPPTQAYAQALRARGVDVSVVTIQGVDHNNILLSPLVYQQLAELIRIEGGVFTPPAHVP